MNRRELLLALAACPVVSARAQARQPVVIGWLDSSASTAGGGRRLATFKEALAALGWKEGPQFVIEARWASGELRRLPALAEELAARKPALIVTSSGQGTLAAVKGAPHVPIVQGNGTDLVAAGLAASLAQPGGMVTGLTNVQVDLTEKLLEVLLAAAPALKRVGFLADSKNPNHALNMKAAQRSVAGHKIEARIAGVARGEEIDAAMSRLANERVQGLVVLSSPLLGFELRRIIKSALTRRWPLIGTNSTWTDAGALLSYGADVLASLRRAAYYADRILKGARPADLPIEQPTKFELIVNRRTAKEIGLALPESLLLQAHRVIE